MSADPVYITTPIYYVNGTPHIGSAYTTIAADAIARYYRLQGRSVFFLTGTDEHGIKNERAARARGVTPQQHADGIADTFKALWRTLGISHDRFIRTTEAQHRRGAIVFWVRLQRSGDLYRATYSGAYCAGCEAYYQEEDLLDSTHCPVHQVPAEHVQEENWFFRLSRYQTQIEQLVATTDFVLPASRRKELLSLIRQGLRDFSVTRRNVRWGIPVPASSSAPAHAAGAASPPEPDEVLYVWVDALSNYLTGIGFPDGGPTFTTYWPHAIHLAGKDIIRFHCLYWPALLLSAGLPLPRHVFAHGWITRGGQKLSKSTGTSIDPAALAAAFGHAGADAVRYYLLRAIPFGQDGDFTEDAFRACYNAGLANDFGNLVQRITTLIARCTAGLVPAPQGAPPLEPEARLLAHARALPGSVAAAFDAIAPDAALDVISGFITTANRYAEETAPWRLVKEAKTDPAAHGRLHAALYHLAEATRLAAWYLSPFIPTTAGEAHRRLAGHTPRPNTAEGTFGYLQPGTSTHTGPPLFPRC